MSRDEMTTPAAITMWHRIVATGDLETLEKLLDNYVTFQSPAVHTPQEGKAKAYAYLSAALEVLGHDSFRYVGEWYGTQSAVLEFEAELDGVYINGIDMITWNKFNQITHFKVMVRPLKGLNKLIELMGAELARQHSA